MVTVNCFLSEKEVFIVRKKSHILLARYLADQMPANEKFYSHIEKAFLSWQYPARHPAFICNQET